LESRKYNYLVEGTMPVLEFDITSGKATNENENKQHLTLELYNPLSGALFEAKFSKGRLEVDSDGSITYFSTKADSVNLSLFLRHNITVSMNKKTGEVLIKSPSKMVSLEPEIRSASRKKSSTEVTTDAIKFRLE